MNIAFLGLGIMGSRMAHNLLKAGVKLTVWNRSQEASIPLAEAGAQVASSVAEAVAEADMVFTMLAKPEAVEEVMMAAGEGLSRMKPGSLWVDCSTVNPSFSKLAAQVADSHGVRFMDAPVAGTKPHAHNAELVFFVGGNTTDVEAASPFMDMMGRKVMHIGEVSKGASFKMLVNSMLAQSMLIFSETLLLGESMGLDPDFLLKMLPNLVVAAPFTKAKAEMIREENYEVQFPLELMHKDLHLASLCGYETGQALPFTNAAKERFADAVQAGYGRLDFAAIHKFLKEG